MAPPVPLAYTAYHAMPFLLNNFKTEADELLPHMVSLLSYPWLSSARPRRMVVDVGAFTGGFSAQAIGLFGAVERRRSDELKANLSHDGRQALWEPKRGTIDIFLALEPKSSTYVKITSTAEHLGWS